MLQLYCYHHVVPLHIYKTFLIKDKYLYVTTIKFEEQMKILKNKNITTLSTNEFINCIKMKRAIIISQLLHLMMVMKININMHTIY
jgi:hypothetical protein